jgi:hypothetical protein
LPRQPAFPPSLVSQMSRRPVREASPLRREPQLPAPEELRFPPSASSHLPAAVAEQAF